MATVIFVHGTGVRKAGYESAMKSIDEGLNNAMKRAGRETVRVTDCLWGDSLGVRQASLSVPEYRKSGGKTTGANPEENLILLWEMLTYDPIYELRGLSLQPHSQAFSVNTGAAGFRHKVEALPTQGLARRLAAAGIVGTFSAARNYVLNQPELDQVLAKASSPGQCRLAVARAILAEAMDRAPVDFPCAVCTDPVLRDSLVQAIADEIIPPDMAPPLEWAANLLFGAAKRMGAMHLVRSRRGRVTDTTGPATGDILLYQAKGHKIRAFIRKQIELAEPPVILLAHSLGGIACVDLLAMENPPVVALLVTVGSQAPYLYEINALSSLDFGDPLPPWFVRRWVNIYDPRDFLSYQGEGVFPSVGNGPLQVADRPVNNKLAFPDAHSGYWANTQTWDLIVPEIPEP